MESEIAEIIKKGYIAKILNTISIFSFMFTGLILFAIFNIFLGISLTLFIILYVIGFILSLILLKSDYFLRFKKTADSSKIESSFAWNLLSEDSTELIKLVGYTNSAIVIIRTIFMNVLNDSFILTIWWLVYVTLIYFLTLITGITIFHNLNIQNFGVVVTSIGVLAGIFQVYVTEYKKEISSRIKEISTLVMTEDVNISYDDFDFFLKEQKDKKVIDLKAKLDGIIKDEQRLSLIMNGFRPYNQKILNLPLSYRVNDLMVFDYIEKTLSENDQTGTKKDLISSYEEYFKKKLEIIKFSREYLISIKKLALSNISFFGDAKINYPLYSKKKTKKPQSFSEFYNKFNYDLNTKMLKELLLS